ncbi:MAG: indole-3-glycerol phosphate synthase TrpC [Ruminiclostridium sp.]|nr:indole-3-glycerol phosphate synthase TrpC [Ruminiclostridium sp.]
MILDRIVEQKRLQLTEEMQQISVEELKRRIQCSEIHKPLDFCKAIKRDGEISIIAEVKKASPSKGIFRENFDVPGILAEYGKADIQAVSVLTEKNFFLGADEYLVKARQILPIPVLRKDFIIDIWQIYQSRCLGADAILLIVSILPGDLLKKFMIIAGILGLHCLVEVHDEAELDRALEAGAKIIGINNRDLKSFKVDLSVTGRLINRIPTGRAVVSESGINTAANLRHLKSLGVDAVLMGEAFMNAVSIPEKILELRMV